MRFFTLLTAILFAVQLHAQDIKGYYINYTGKRIEGYFKQGDFTNLSSLEFRQSKKDYIKMTPDLVKEYGVGDEFKFEKHLVKMDNSQTGGTERGFQWSDETVFLSVVIEGEATLYSYTKEYNTKFFLKTKNKQEPEQLMFKKYKDADGAMAENNGFRQQLYNEVKCPGQAHKDFSEVLYERKQLSDVVKNYNNCHDVKSKEYFNGLKRESGFSYTFIAGIYNLKFGLMDAEVEMGTQDNIKFGFAAEAAYTFRSENISLFVGLEYELMSSKLEHSYKQPFNTIHKKYEIDGNALNFYFGPRYNLVINPKNKVFFDLAPGISVPFGDISETTTVITDTGISYAGDGSQYELKPGFYCNLGVGYTFDEKYGIALRYQTRRDFLDDVYSTYKTDITRLGIILRYTFK